MAGRAWRATPARPCSPRSRAQLNAGPFKFLFDFGARWRRDTKFAGARFTDVLVFGASAGLPLFPPELEASLEARGETPMDDVGDRTGSPLEALLGLKLHAPRAWTFGAAGGVGILRGYGSPDARFVVMAGYTYAPSEHPSEPGPSPWRRTGRQPKRRAPSRS